MRDFFKKVGTIFALILASDSNALVVMASKRKSGIQFNFGCTPMYIIRRSTWITSFHEIFDAAMLVGPSNSSLIVAGSDARLAANEDQISSFLQGEKVNFTNTDGQVVQNPSDNVYQTALFGTDADDLRVRAYLPFQEHKATSAPIERSAQLSHLAFEFFGGIRYTFHSRFALWCRGGYVFPTGFFESKDGNTLKELNYVLNTKDKEVDSALGGQALSVDVYDRAFEAFAGTLLSNAKVQVAVREGFSAIGGVAISPAEDFAVELGIGLRQYSVRAKVSDGVMSYPHADKAYTDRYARSAGSSNFTHNMVTEDLKQEVYPAVLYVGFVLQKGSFSVGLTFSYTSFSINLSADGGTAKSSKSRKSFAGSSRTYTAPGGASPVYRDVADIRGFTMSHVGDVVSRFETKANVRDISVGLQLGVVL